jgi:CRISPR-associated protein Cmr1
VTPAFLHGAHRPSSGRSAPVEAELRASSFEGLIRYWFRAALADHALLPGECSRKSYSNCGCLPCIEGRLFGSADHGRGLVFRIVDAVRATSQEKKLLLPHKNSSPSPAIPAGTSFGLRIHLALVNQPEEHLRAATAAAWLAFSLGGVGQRSRRGAGSFAIRKIDGDPVGLPVAEGFAGVDDLANHLRTGIEVALRAIRALGSPRPPGAVPEFPMLTPRAARVQVVPLEARENEEKARSEIMCKLRDFKDPVFGLPHLLPAAGKPKVNGRHASPVWIRLVRLKDGQFAAVQTTLRSATATLSGNWTRIEDYLKSSLSSGGKIIDLA